MFETTGTGAQQVFERARGAMAGASACLAKPLTREALLAAVRLHLASRF